MDALYYYLRMLRLLLWALFLLACVLLALVSPTKFNFPNMLLNAPIIMLTAACLVGLLEKLVRWWHGLPPKRWLGHSQWWGTTDAELFAAIRTRKGQPRCGRRSCNAYSSRSRSGHAEYGWLQGLFGTRGRR